RRIIVPHDGDGVLNENRLCVVQQVPTEQTDGLRGRKGPHRNSAANRNGAVRCRQTEEMLLPEGMCVTHNWKHGEFLGDEPGGVTGGNGVSRTDTSGFASLNDL